MLPPDEESTKQDPSRVDTKGGDYAEGDIDKRQGIFAHTINIIYHVFSWRLVLVIIGGASSTTLIIIALVLVVQQPRQTPSQWSPQFEEVKNLFSNGGSYTASTLTITDDTLWIALYDRANPSVQEIVSYQPIGSSRRLITSPQVTSNTYVSSLWFEDHTLWVAHFAREVFVGSLTTDPITFSRIFSSSTDLAIHDLIRDSDHRIWIATSSGGFLQLPYQTSWYHLKTIQDFCPDQPSVPFELEINDMVYHQQQHVIWLATNQGLIAIDDVDLEGKVHAHCFTTESVATQSTTMLSNSLKSVALHPNGQPCVGTLQGAVGCLTLEGSGLQGAASWHFMSVVPTGDVIQALIVLPDGSMMAGSDENGLFITPNSHSPWQAIQLAHGGIGGVEINAIGIGPDHRVWVATNVGCFRSNQVKTR